MSSKDIKMDMAEMKLERWTFIVKNVEERYMYERKTIKEACEAENISRDWYYKMKRRIPKSDKSKTVSFETDA